MKNARMNIPHFRFTIFDLVKKNFLVEIVTSFMLKMIHSTGTISACLHCTKIF